MRLARARVEDHHRPWLVRLEGDTAAVLAEESDHVAADVLREAIHAGLDLTGPGVRQVAAAELTLLAPLSQPSKIVCTALNYRSHANETGQAIPVEPRFFSKFATSIIGPGDVVEVRDQELGKLDYEGELAVIIGRQSRSVSIDTALEHVFGYTVANDVSARGLQKSDPQWWRAKASDDFCPMGPDIVTSDEFDGEPVLAVQTRVNGQLRQDGSTSDLIFPIAELIAYVTRFVTLNPGDVLLTGTPPGVGVAMDPPSFLVDGDEVEIEIEQIGSLRNSIRISG